MKKSLIFLSAMMALNLFAGEYSEVIEAKLGPAGEIPHYLVVGPVPAPQEGFGTLVLNKELDILSNQPVLGDQIATPLIAGGSSAWSLQGVDTKGYLNLHPTFSWLLPGDDPERIWHAQAAFASITLVSEDNKPVKLLMGTASQAQLFLNGAEVWRESKLRAAVADEDTVSLNLTTGENHLVFKIYQTHQNCGLSFFGGTPWQWGLFARITDPSGGPVSGLITQVFGNSPDNYYNLASTPFFRENESGELLQKFQVTVSSQQDVLKTELNLGNTASFDLGSISMGMSYHEIWMPAQAEGGKIQTSLTLDALKLQEQVNLKPQRKWELYYMPFSHQDIGYTHTQPVTAEIQAKNLEDVLDYMKQDLDFKWTVESLWQLEQLFKRQGQTYRDEFFKRVAEGRISLSPGWTNSFTGQLSEEEALRSLEPAIQLAKKEGIEYPAFLYNDTPGVSWLWPGLLEELGVHFIFTGINEVYNDYSLQRNLPKLFRWQGGDGGEVFTYLTETYNEGLAHGLEKGPEAMSMLIAGQLARLENRNWPYSHVGLSVSYLDNGGVPKTQLANIDAWNKQYAWPKIIIATTGDYVSRLETEDLSKLPVLKGDWTSPWETRSQGEPARMILQREAQALAPTAEKLDVINWLEGDIAQPDELAVQDIYTSLLDFSGHGSGLEAGYGNLEDNALANSYRELYVTKAWHASRDLAERDMYRLIVETFSFAGQGVLVFNPSSFPRSEVIQVSFGRMPAKPLEVVDARTGKTLPAAWMDDETLVFMATDMVGMGYTKFLLRGVTSSLAPEVNDLAWNQTAKKIENEYFIIEYSDDASDGLIKSLYSKKLKKQIFDASHELSPLSFVSRRPMLGESFTAIKFPRGEVEVIDLRPAGFLLRIEAKDQLAESIEIGVWTGMPVLDIKASINLEALTTPQSIEEIGLALPQVSALKNIQAELAGGWINPATELLPGVTPEALSLRNGMLLKQKKYCMAVTTRDARVLLMEKDLNGKVLPVLNLVNNFPKHWNRNEVNQGSLTFHLKLEPLKRRSSPVDVSQLAVATAEPLLIRDTWLSQDTPEKSALSVRGSGLSIQSMKRSRDGQALIMRIKNSGISGHARGVVSSNYFGPQTTIYTSDIMERKGELLKCTDGGFKLELSPRQIISLRVENLITPGKGD